MTIEWFFLMNFFWLKTGMAKSFQDMPDRSFEQGITYNNIYLSSGMLNTSTYGATLTQALKCALANCVAFSAVLGRTGPLGAFILTVFGTFAFELNRNVIEVLHYDLGDTYEIFVFGGFMGLAASLVLSIKENKNVENQTARHIKYSGGLVSISISFLGALVIFTLLPILISDPEIYEMGIFSQFYIAPLSVWYAMASSTILATAISTLINSNIIARDMINGLVAGGVACCTAAFYFTNPVWPMVLGSTAGALQSVLQNVAEKKVAKSQNIRNTHSFALFGVQGILGAIFAAIFRQVVKSRNDGFDFDFSQKDIATRNGGYEIAVALVSAGIGLFSGFLIGAFLAAATKHERDDHFDDYTYWMADDGIRYPRAAHTHTPIIEEEEEEEEPGDIYIKETTVNVKNKHAYL